MRLKLVVVALCVAMPLASCHSSRRSLDQERRAVLTAEREWAAAARDQDLDRSVSYMADDAVMFPPGSAPVVGKAAIRDYMAAGFATPGFSVTWEAEEVVVAAGGGLAYTRSRSVYTVPGPGGTDSDGTRKGCRDLAQGCQRGLALCCRHLERGAVAGRQVGLEEVRAILGCRLTTRWSKRERDKVPASITPQRVAQRGL